jgi:hypothetical protein
VALTKNDEDPYQVGVMCADEGFSSITICQAVMLK